jgi:hypothetical protein
VPLAGCGYQIGKYVWHKASTPYTLVISIISKVTILTIITAMGNKMNTKLRQEQQAALTVLWKKT